ncbi:MAG: murein DD-endopeptidase MepM/ murein hydrolase activator NlpD [Planctomycetota bacterium]|jgi:murein DD-endopeptidase MepM/ murein hydrolase activator NlpD
MTDFREFLQNHSASFEPMFRPGLTQANTIPIDLSSASYDFNGLDEAALDQAIADIISDGSALAAVGGYLEKRSVYRATDLFDGDQKRCIHVGVDVFIAAASPLFLPFAGVVHSFANRQLSGDYGPVIIMKHDLDGFEFHSLYGHLSESSLEGLFEGKAIVQGEKFAEVGARPLNGNWPPHLHFQFIRDMQGKQGDYPGVARLEEIDFFKQNCPDPTGIILSA